MASPADQAAATGELTVTWTEEVRYEQTFTVPADLDADDMEVLRQVIVEQADFQLVREVLDRDVESWRWEGEEGEPEQG